MATPNLTVQLALDESAVNFDWGSVWYYKRVTSTGAPLATPDTFHIGAGRMEPQFKFGQQSEQQFDAGNKPFGVKLLPVVSELQFKVMQSDGNTEEFFTKGVQRQWFSIIEDAGISKRHSGGEHSLRLLRFYPIVKFDPLYEVAGGNRMSIVTARIQNNYASASLGPLSTIASLSTFITEAELDVTAGGAVTFSVPVGDMYDWAECQMTN